MKKIALVGDDRNLHVYNSSDYIIFDKDNQHISDKYVDYNSIKINTYKDLGKGDIIIRQIYFIDFHKNNYEIFFKKTKHYGKYVSDHDYTDNMKENLNTKDSIFNSDDVMKGTVINVFSNKMNVFMNVFTA